MFATSNAIMLLDRFRKDKLIRLDIRSFASPPLSKQSAVIMAMLKSGAGTTFDFLGSEVTV